jgi:hypothetical protein
LQFYKNSYLTYNLTFENPISWIVAYGYALASTDFKLATEWIIRINKTNWNDFILLLLFL